MYRNDTHKVIDGKLSVSLLYHTNCWKVVLYNGTMLKYNLLTVRYCMRHCTWCYSAPPSNASLYDTIIERKNTKKIFQEVHKQKFVASSSMG